MDAGVYAGWNVPIDYDPLLAKLSVWAETRELAIERMRRAVREYRVLGTVTNLPFFEDLMRDECWRAGDLDTGFLEGFRERRRSTPADDLATVAAALAAAQTSRNHRAEEASRTSDRWRAAGLDALVK